MKAVRLSVIALSLALAFASYAAAQDGATPVNFKGAFIGDQGLGHDAAAVLHVIRSEGAAAVIHSGDFRLRRKPRRLGSADRRHPRP